MITTKQRATLRAMAHSLDAIFQIGKGGINDNMVKQVDDALNARELVKITVLNNSPIDAYEACDELARRLNAAPVSTIGGKFVLYRESPERKQIYLD